LPEVEQRTYTLTQLNQSIENWVQNSFATRRFWISCQIAKINEKNGHRYLELVDSVNGIQTSKARGVIWKSSYNDIEIDFEQHGLETQHVLKAGNELRMQVVINFHKLYGFSLVVNKIDSSAILGDIEKQKQETLNRLTKEGLLDLQKRLYLSPLSKRIALIGSPGTNGFEDFFKELTQNNIYVNFILKTFPVTVQGDSAIVDISKAIEEASEYDVDAIVIVRGGGSKMDLHIFNHYLICNTIANCKIPVIVGVGHENDNSLADQVAFKGEKTPTAAAKYFYIKIGVFSAQLSEVMKNIKLEILGILGSASDELRYYAYQVFSIVDEVLKSEKDVLLTIFSGYRLSAINTINREKHYLNNVVNSIYKNTKEKLYNSLNLLNGQLSKLQLKFVEVVKVEWSVITNVNTSIITSAKHIVSIDKPREIEIFIELFETRLEYFLSSSKEKLAFIIKKIKLVDPTRLFKSGYTISTIDGKDVNKYKGEMMDKTLLTHSENKTIESRITKIKNKER
jgi:exodeoxyribonuclease VII large subunit